MTARTMLPFDPAVVAPWQVGSGHRGVLMLHGFAGTPPELRGLGEHLAARGWRCAGPRLAGHGTTPEDLAKTRRTDWRRSARGALRELQQSCDEVMVCGQSMGGTMALHLAATQPEIRAVATLAAPITIASRARPFLPLLKHVIRWQQPSGETDLYRREGVEELHSYGRRSTGAIHELFMLMDETADELAMVRQPVLLLQGGRDRVVEPRNLDLIGERLVCSSAVERVLLPRSGHAISVDIDSEAAFNRVAAWFERWSGRAARVSA